MPKELYFWNPYRKCDDSFIHLIFFEIGFSLLFFQEYENAVKMIWIMQCSDLCTNYVQIFCLEITWNKFKFYARNNDICIL